VAGAVSAVGVSGCVVSDKGTSVTDRMLLRVLY
jgi:hypothetical protein